MWPLLIRLLRWLLTEAEAAEAKKLLKASKIVKQITNPKAVIKSTIKKQFGIEAGNISVGAIGKGIVKTELQKGVLKNLVEDDANRIKIGGFVPKETNPFLEEPTIKVVASARPAEVNLPALWKKRHDALMERVINKTNFIMGLTSDANEILANKTSHVIETLEYVKIMNEKLKLGEKIDVTTLKEYDELLNKELKDLGVRSMKDYHDLAKDQTMDNKDWRNQVIRVSYDNFMDKWIEGIYKYSLEELGLSDEESREDFVNSLRETYGEDWYEENKIKHIYKEAQGFDILGTLEAEENRKYEAVKRKAIKYVKPKK